MSLSSVGAFLLEHSTIIIVIVALIFYIASWHLLVKLTNCDVLYVACISAIVAMIPIAIYVIFIQQPTCDIYESERNVHFHFHCDNAHTNNVS